MKQEKQEAMVKRGPLGEQKGVREDQEEKRIGSGRTLVFVIHCSFSSPLCLFPEHRSLLSSTVFVLHSPSLSPILSLALLPYSSHVRSPPFSALPFIASIP